MHVIAGTNNSQVVRAESASAAGPYHWAAEVYPEFHHNVSKNDEFCSQNEGLCVKKREVLYQTRGIVH